LTLGAALAVAGAVAGLITPTFNVSDVPGPFYAAKLALFGRFEEIIQLLSTVGVLTGLEFALRTSKGATRWRIKYLVLGLGGIFLVRFYLLSHILLFQVLFGVYLVSEAATVFVGNLVIGASLLRNGLLGIEFTVSRLVLYRSVVVGVLGLYLFVAGAMGWLLSWLGIPDLLFWSLLVVFASAMGLAMVMMSEDVRWRIKRFIGTHFYRSKYDYREQWTRFTKRLGSIVTLEELTPQLLGAVIEAVGATRGALYLADDHEGQQHFAGAIEVSRMSPTLSISRELMNQFVAQRAPLVLENGNGHHAPVSSHATELIESFKRAELAVLIPLIVQDRLVGLMAVGPERTGDPYTHEDLELLATFGEQAVGAIVTVRLSEKLAQTREFEAFHRLTSFVIHDLKNSISALSMLVQNALENFSDPEFQRDAIKTLSKTVGRMKGLLAKLSSGPDTQDLKFQPVDLITLVTESVAPLMSGKRVRLLKQLHPLPLIEGDPEALQKVIQNLTTNAIEATEDNGEITIKTYQDEGRVVFSITDTGHGIPPDFLRKSLFTPFRSTKKGGWGIGLYQAKWIVESHGGTIEVTSKEGIGTTFWVKLPVVEQRSGQGEN
jgi:putative PEP-CTERM system histidine kinase